MTDQPQFCPSCRAPMRLLSAFDMWHCTECGTFVGTRLLESRDPGLAYEVELDFGTLENP